MHKILPLKFVLSDSLVTYDPHNYSLIQENFNILLDAFSLSLYSLWYRYPLIQHSDFSASRSCFWSLCSFYVAIYSLILIKGSSTISPKSWYSSFPLSDLHLLFLQFSSFNYLTHILNTNKFIPFRFLLSFSSCSFSHLVSLKPHFSITIYTPWYNR